MAEEARKSLLKKKELVASYRDKFQKSNGFVVFFNFQGIDAFPLSELRAKIRAVNGEVVVGRNTLLYRAFEDTPLVDHRDLFVGPSAALFAYEDVVSTTKTLIEFLKEAFDKEYKEKVKGGLLNNRYMTPEDVVALAELPSRKSLSQAYGCSDGARNSARNDLEGCAPEARFNFESYRRAKILRRFGYGYTHHRRDCRGYQEHERS
ncbi:50S ribosomal protein L10 [Hydrogenivirga sp. 128-5-R1-1]|uniref:50S ribosomal protein L10 n=1 Tax=Hydrogenivirga sp. 128-5-R1-1 TaxID=392423 RepID=UPI00015F3253|nr:50S ribosomal protein L10 [Hydrogenivirga sp. 128-5-R1-1]EDP74464.1 ribosomal protein L10 [Hydrogenivirga sp. 128-5-R1-1]